MTDPPIRSAEHLDQSSVAALRAQQHYEFESLMNQLSWTQEDVARALGYRDQTTVSKIIDGTRDLPLDGAIALDRLGYRTSLGVSFEALHNYTAAAGRRVDSSQAERRSWTGGVFLSSPLASAHRYRETRDLALELSRAIETYCDETVYYAGRGAPTNYEFDAPDFALRDNTRALAEARYFALYVPETLREPSSIWVEAGFALARRIPSIYFAADPRSIPFMLREILRNQSVDWLPRIAVHWLSDTQRAVEIVRRFGPDLLRRLDS